MNTYYIHMNILLYHLRLNIFYMNKPMNQNQVPVYLVPIYQV